MNRLIDRARRAAWSFAQDVVANESDVVREGEVAVVASPGAMMWWSMSTVLGLANLLNDLQAFIEELLKSELLRLRRETPVHMYRTDPSRPEKTLPFHRMHAEACASVLVLGFQMTAVVHSVGVMKGLLDESADEVDKWKRKHREKIYSNE